MEGFFKSFKPLAKWVTKHKLESIFLVVALVTSICSSILFFNIDQKPEENVETEEIITIRKSYVDLSGAVVKPDVYEITTGTRLKDVITKAKGLTEEADKAFFNRNFNLARILIDQEKIYIPTVSEVGSGLFAENQLNLGPLPITAPDMESPSLININTATVEELDALPGIGQTTANKIIKARPFLNTEDLINKKIVKKNVWENIKDLVSAE